MGERRNKPPQSLAKEKSAKLKEKLIETQTGKKFLYPPEPSRLKLDGKTIENCEDLDEFCDEILNELEKGVQLSLGYAR